MNYEQLNLEAGDKSSIQIAPHASKETLFKIRKTVSNVFSESTEYYLNMRVETYRELMLQAQNIINKENIVFLLVKEIESDLIKYLQTDNFLVQSSVYLRASRPILNPETENIGWHRETFYGQNMEKSVNCWTPVQGVTEDNTLRYVPESHLIPDEKIIVSKNESESTKRYSAGHKLGFQYSPKKIVSGVDLSNASKLIVGNGESALFSGNLIHGAAVNKAKSIRFSIDFRLIRKADYTLNKKSLHITSSKPYFIEYC